MILMMPIVADLAPAKATLPMLVSARRPEFPYELNGRDEQRFVRIAVTVSPAGKPIRCLPIVASGRAGVDKAACDAFKVARFKPATDRDGRASYGIFAFTLMYSGYSPDFEGPPSADLTLAVAKMPEGEKEYSTRSAALIVDEAGNARSCDPVTEGKPSALDKPLCSVALDRLKFSPALDEQGKPVPSVQGFQVLFTGPGVGDNLKMPMKRDTTGRHPFGD